MSLEARKSSSQPFSPFSPGSLILLIGRSEIIFLVLLGLGGFILYEGRGVLLPFCLGFLVAYALRKFVARLEAWSLPRSYGAFLVLFCFFVGLGAVISILIPLIKEESRLFLTALPGYLDRLYTLGFRVIGTLLEYVSDQDLNHFRQEASHSLRDVVRWTGGIVTQILSGSTALATLGSILMITPVVAFYLLKDWPQLIGTLEGWIPRTYLPILKEQLLLVDQILSAFAHGQLSICLVLGAYYTFLLSWSGVNFAPILGILTGLLSFIPFIGFLIGALLTGIVALGQYETWEPFGILGAIFLLGQVLESQILVPHLLGNRIGLHPVWVIFALLAGFQWGGFLGVVFAMPLAAVVGVLCRFLLSRYLKSKFFRGRK